MISLYFLNSKVEVFTEYENIRGAHEPIVPVIREERNTLEFDA